MNNKTKQILDLSVLVLSLATFLLFMLRIIDALMFWILIGLAALYTYVLRKKENF